jgi:cell division protein FtsL
MKGKNMRDFEKEYKDIEQQVERGQKLITAIIMVLVVMILLVSYQLGLYLKELEAKQENIRKLSIENEDLKEQIYVLQMKGDN